MNLRIAQVVGLNTDQKAAQVTSSTREDNTFLAVLLLASDDAFTKGRQALSELEDFYFEFEGSASEKLNAAYAEAVEKLFKGADFSLMLAAISGKVLYIIGKGAMEVYLKRLDKLSPLLSIGKEAQLISGFLQDGDRLLFATGSLITFLGEDLNKSLSLPLETFEEELGGKIGSSDVEEQGLAVLTVEIQEEETEIPTIATQDVDVLDQSADEVYSPAAKSERPVLSIFSKVIEPLVNFKKYLPGSGKGRLILALVLLVIIAAGAAYQYKQSLDRKKDAQFNQLLQESRDSLNAALGLAVLNPQEAKNKLDFAEEKISQAVNLKPANADAQNLKKEIEEKLPTVLQQSSIADFPVFLDMDLVKKNFRASLMSLSKGKLLLLDPAVETLVVIDIEKKSNQILAGSENLGDALFASINGGLAFVYSKDKGILKIDIANKKVTTIAKKDSDFKDVSDIYGFAGNVYLLDPGSNQIWKYLPTAQGYSDKREYLNKNAQADFNGALRMQIESSVYILKQGGQISRFTKGDKDHFAYAGLPSGVKDPKSLFISSDADDLYLLDSGNSRLLILTKTGEYKAQMTGEKFGTATDLVVDEVGKKVYLLEGSKIYSVDLK